MTSFHPYGRKPRDHGAVLIDGMQAERMSREAVYDAMHRKRIPGIASDMGRQQLIDILMDWQAAHPEQKPGPPIVDRPGPEAA
jgi:hypothetical protein